MKTILIHGREFNVKPMPNGAQELKAADGGTISEVEWEAYCARAADAAMPETIKPTAKNRSGWRTLKHCAYFAGGRGAFWLPKSGNVIGGLGTVASFTSQEAARLAIGALGLKEDSQ